jgi:hypothetical protein
MVVDIEVWKLHEKWELSFLDSSITNSFDNGHHIGNARDLTWIRGVPALK